MVKQTKHMRKNYLSGRGKGHPLIGKLVYYKKEVYQVTKYNQNRTFNLSNRTAGKSVQNVKRSEIRRYS